MSRFLRLATVLDVTGATEPTIYRWIANGEFPKSIKIGPRATAWLEDEVADWQRARIAASRETEPPRKVVLGDMTKHEPKED